MKTTEEILRDAADLVQFTGWCRFKCYDEETDEYCAAGAIYKVALGDVYGWSQQVSEVIDTMSDYLRRQDLPCLVEWNNTVAESGSEVADMMRQLAKELEREDLSA